MLSLSRMRADARSLMMYCRRTYLNTERKGSPSSVFKKGSLSHRSVGQSQSQNGVKHLRVATDKEDHTHTKIPRS